MNEVLVIDADPGERRRLCRALRTAGYQARSVSDGLDGLHDAGSRKPDLVVVDPTVPGIAGPALLAALLADAPHRQVIVISQIDRMSTQVEYLDAGAADVVSKPFDTRDVLARVRRRLRDTGQGPCFAAHDVVVGDSRLDARLRCLVTPDAVVDLAPREFFVLQYLMSNVGSVCTRTELRVQVWGDSAEPGSNLVDVAIARLRGKSLGMRIDTVRSAGYVLHPPVSNAS